MGIMILGAPGAGKTSLGKRVAQALGFDFIDIDEYIWRKDTPQPFTVMYSREGKISRLKNAIADPKRFVMAGSMDSFHEHFDPLFDLMVYLDTDADVRVQRAHDRELKAFGDRILPGGDMYAEHQHFLQGVAGYDHGIGGTNRQLHQKWLDSLKCPVLYLNGADAYAYNVQKIIEALAAQ